MQSKKELESWYSQKDPWGYETNPDDALRKRKILDLLEQYAPFNRALDIGAGEGFITRDLPAKEIHAIELSDLASSRLPVNVKRVIKPEGKYDLVIANGVLYSQYDYKELQKLILEASSGYILTTSIEEWEMPLPLNLNLIERWSYRDKYTQVLRFYENFT